MAEFEDLVGGPESTPKARRDELATLERGEKLVDENQDLSRKLTFTVNRLFAATRQEINDAGREVTTVQS